MLLIIIAAIVLLANMNSVFYESFIIGILIADTIVCIMFVTLLDMYYLKNR